MSLQITIEELRNVIISNNKKIKKNYSGIELESILNGFNYLFNTTGSDFKNIFTENIKSVVEDNRIPSKKNMSINEMLYYDKTIKYSNK